MTSKGRIIVVPIPTAARDIRPILRFVRIVSLLPSATEICFALGLGDELVGLTHECDYPPEAADIPVMTADVGSIAGATGREINDRVTASVHGGDSIYRLSTDAYGFQTVLNVFVGSVLVSSVMLVVMTWIMFAMSWQLALVSLASGTLTFELTGGSACLRMAEQRMMRGHVAAMLGDRSLVLTSVWSQPLGGTRLKLRCRLLPAGGPGG